MRSLSIRLRRTAPSTFRFGISHIHQPSEAAHCFLTRLGPGVYVQKSSLGGLLGDHLRGPFASLGTDGELHLVSIHGSFEQEFDRIALPFRGSGEGNIVTITIRFAGCDGVRSSFGAGHRAGYLGTVAFELKHDVAPLSHLPFPFAGDIGPEQGQTNYPRENKSQTHNEAPSCSGQLTMAGISGNKRDSRLSAGQRRASARIG